jgi:hypothetical protein
VRFDEQTSKRSGKPEAIRELPMTKDNEHVKALSAARDSLVMERRDLATTLSKPYRRGHSEETLERLTSVQLHPSKTRQSTNGSLAGVAQPTDTLGD